MSIRKTAFVEGEYYHIYNRGVDKRDVFLNDLDMQRFLQSMDEFNVSDPIGSIYQNSFSKDQLGSSTPKLRLVNFVSYCLNPNHYHFILEQVGDRGIEKFMQRLGTGYTNYFNNKYKRSGALFQGKFKSIHIDSNEYLLHLSAYVNLNNRAHQLGSRTPKLVRSSWGEYIGDYKNNFCSSGVILDQFKSRKKYEKFAESSLGTILERKAELRGVENYLLE